MNELTVTVSVQELVDVISGNRDRHRDVFEKAVRAYRERAIKALEEKISDIMAGRRTSLSIMLPTPEDHTEDYERTIDMLRMHQRAGGDTIDISSTDYACYVRDDWHWKRQWAASTASYLVEEG